ncbi:MAG: phage gp6-like head-tail connector protein [Bacilli bacterium]|nr:phage gp6-like head-tail connector protein [Bacilli bacterium]
MDASDLLTKVKENLIITFEDDDSLITSFIVAAIEYAESYQHLDAGCYKLNPMGETTKQGIIMLASYFYESRDGSSGGFFASSASASEQTWKTVNTLLRLDRNWKV